MTNKMRDFWDIFYLVIALFVLAIVFYAIYSYSMLSGNWDTITTEYLEALPYLFLIGSGFYFLTRRRGR